jgi:hypothetical protein
MCWVNMFYISKFCPIWVVCSFCRFCISGPFMCILSLISYIPFQRLKFWICLVFTAQLSLPYKSASKTRVVYIFILYVPGLQVVLMRHVAFNRLAILTSVLFLLHMTVSHFNMLTFKMLLYFIFLWVLGMQLHYVSKIWYDILWVQYTPVFRWLAVIFLAVTFTFDLHFVQQWSKIWIQSLKSFSPNLKPWARVAVSKMTLCRSDG